MRHNIKTFNIYRSNWKHKVFFNFLIQTKFKDYLLDQYLSDKRRRKLFCRKYIYPSLNKFVDAFPNSGLLGRLRDLVANFVKYNNRIN